MEVVWCHQWTKVDELAQTVSDAFNAIHNDGAGFPPPADLTGAQATTLNSEHLYSGSVRIALLQPSGIPALSPYSNEVGLRVYFTLAFN